MEQIKKRTRMVGEAMTAKQPISEAYLLHELMDPNVAKFPREHAAVREIERLRAELKMLYDAASDLIEVTRMPNIEHVADAHNAAVRLLRTGHYGTAMNALKK